jgi:transcriptional regulator GlxA family with amidase domain
MGERLRGSPRKALKEARAMTLRVACLVYENFLLLDATGPMAAFEQARYAGSDGYTVELVAAEAGSVRSSCGIELLAAKFDVEAEFHTVLVPGGKGALDRRRYQDLLPLLQQASKRGCCIASICSGAFVLAEAGLLDGRRAATHWMNVVELRARYPAIEVDDESIFVLDKGVWTSAGATSGIDLALALVESDYGSVVAQRVSQLLVVPLRRPGTQSQHSALLENIGPDNRFNDVLTWARLNLRQPLSVEQLAERSKLSVRQFSRAFRETVGTSPARAVERLRVKSAGADVRRAVKSFEQIALDCGFGDPGRMTRSFRRITGETPQALRRHARLHTERGQPAD